MGCGTFDGVAVSESLNYFRCPHAGPDVEQASNSGPIIVIFGDAKITTALLDECTAQRALLVPGNPGPMRLQSGINRGDNMNSIKIAALILIAAGILGLVYGGFTYTKVTHEAKIGPIDMAVKEKETINVPIWAGVGAIVLGCGLLLVGGKRS
jgi:hypothetical protein